MNLLRKFYFNIPMSELKEEYEIFKIITKYISQYDFKVCSVIESLKTETLDTLPEYMIASA